LIHEPASLTPSLKVMKQCVCVCVCVSQCEQESVLEQREQQCLLEAERLRCEREELEAQLLEYQHNLDRLREGQRGVEREKEQIDAQQQLLLRWRHHRQSSLPVAIRLDGHQVKETAARETGSGGTEER